MPISSLRWRFDAENLRDVPDGPGVFTLWDDGELVLIGRTEGSTVLRELLRELLQSVREQQVPATHFTWEITTTPRTRAGDLLNAFLEKYGRLPRYNAAPRGDESRHGFRA